MSNLETKTTRQVIDTALGTENWDLKGFYKNDEPETKVDFEKPIWVNCVEAQKEIAQAEDRAIEAIANLKESFNACIQQNVDSKAKIEAANKKVNEVKLDAILSSMMAIYEGSAEWNKGYKAGAADMIIKIQKELLPVLEVPRNREQQIEKQQSELEKPSLNMSEAERLNIGVGSLKKKQPEQICSKADSTNVTSVQDVVARSAPKIPRSDEQKSGESAPGVGDGSDPKKCSSLPIERQLRASKTKRKERKEIEESK